MNRLKAYRRCSFTLLIVGILVLYMSYLSHTSDRMLVWSDEHQWMLNRTKNWVLFDVLSITALLVGLIFIAYAVRRQLILGDRNALRRIARRRRLFQSMEKRMALWFNLLLFLLAAWSGYSSAEMSWSQPLPAVGFPIVALSLTVLLVLVTVFCFRNNRLIKPSFSRFGLSWHRDPLQVIFILTWCLFAMVAGSWLRLRNAGVEQFGRIEMVASVVAGLVIGQAFAYLIFRRRIF